MKKVLISAAAVLAGMGLLSAPVFAAEISNTGPGSDNSITSTNDTDCSVENNNNVDVDNDNSQGANSGDSTNGSNTNGGNSNSGNANNSNSSDVNVDVNNSGCCDCESTTTPTPTPPSEPSTGGEGGEVLSATTTEPATLAETGPGLMSTPVVASIVFVGAGASLLAGAAVARRALK